MFQIIGYTQNLFIVYSKKIFEIIHALLSGDLTCEDLSEFIVSRIRMRVAGYLDSGKVVCKDHIYEVTYYDGDRRYKFRFPRAKGVRKIIKAQTPNGEDVTDDLFEFLGPGHNFYGIPTSPVLLGWSEGVTIQYRDGTEKFFMGDDHIELSSS